MELTVTVTEYDCYTRSVFSTPQNTVQMEKTKNKYEKQHEKYLALTGGRRLNATASIPAPTSPPVTATVPAKRHHALDEPKLPYHTLKTILPTLTKPALHMQGDYPYYIRLRFALNKRARLD